MALPGPRRQENGPPSLGQRILLAPMALLRGVFVEFPAFLLFHLRMMPPGIRYGLLAVFLTGAGAGGYFVYDRLVIQRNAKKVVILWQQFDFEAGKQETEKMTEILDELAVRDARDPRVANRRRMMETLEADPADQTMIFYCMFQNMRKNNLEGAKREAEKRIAYAPRDWTARCLMAQFALAAGDRPKAIEHLKMLPDAGQERRLSPVGVMQGIQLLKACEMPYESLREFLVNRIVPAIKGNPPDRLPTPDKLVLFRCYMSSFEFLDQYPDLTTYWVPYGALSQALIDDPEAQTEALADMGNMVVGQYVAFEKLAALGKFPKADVPDLRKELLDRLDKCWARVKEKDTKNPMGYIGPALVLDVQGKKEEAIALIQEGLKACGDKPELIRWMTGMVQQNNPLAALQIAKEAVARNPKDLNLLGMLIENAKAANRPDMALDACKLARQIAPDNVPLSRYEAELWLDRGRPSEAIGALAGVKDKLMADDGVYRAYLRALSKLGGQVEIGQIVDEVALKAQRPEPWMTGLEAARTAGMTEYAIAGARKLTEKWASFLPGWKLLGDLHADLAKPADGRPEYDLKAAQAALNAYRNVLSRDSGDEETVHKVVWLELKALGKVDLADRDCTLLKIAEKERRLAPWRRSTLGALLTEKGQYEDARAILEAIVAGPAAPNYHIHLGTLYARMGRKEEAWSHLKQAGSMPKEPWETFELEKAVELLKKVP